MKQKFEVIFSNNRIRTMLTVIITAIIVTAAIGIGSALADDNNIKALTISEKAAKEIAFSKTDGGILESFSLDYEDGIKIYKIDIVKGEYEYELEINAETGEVRSFSQEKVKLSSTTVSDAALDGKSETDSSETSKSGNSTSDSANSGGSESKSATQKKSSKKSSTDNGFIGKSKAKSIALGRVGGGTVVSCHLDYDDGIAEYDIKIFYGKYEYELEINAKSGRITDYEKELRDKYEHHDDDDDWDDHDDHHDHHDD